MVFRYETTQDREFAAELPLEAGAAAGRTVCLVKTLNEWFGQPPRIYHRDGTDQLQVD